MFFTQVFPTLICLSVEMGLFYVVRIMDQTGNPRAARKGLTVSLSIGILMAAGIPLYFRANFEITDYWIVPLIFFGSLISLNALKGLFPASKTLGRAWWYLSIALVLQYLLFQYGSLSAYGLLKPSVQASVAKLAIFILLTISGTNFLLVIFSRLEAGQSPSDNAGRPPDNPRKPDDSPKSPVGRVSAVVGAVIIVLELINELLALITKLDLSRWLK